MTDFSQTLPEAEVLPPGLGATEPKDIKRDARTTELITEVADVRKDILSISHSLSPARAVPFSLRHPEEVAAIAIWGATVIRIGRGKIKATPVGTTGASRG